MTPASAELAMPEELRRYLSAPWTIFRVEVLRGPREYVASILRNLVNPLRTSVVGDVVCSTFLSAIGRPRLCVVDTKTLRFEAATPVDEGVFEFVDRCVNARGTISLQCVEAMIELLELQAPSLLVVEGEEDLLALPLVAMGCTDVVFGLPRVGVCIVRRGLDNVVKAINVLSRFRGFESWSRDRYAEILG